MSDPRFVFSLLAMMIGGFVTFCGLYLMVKQKTIADPEGSFIEVQIPFFGKLKTNYPSVVALVLGASLVYYPLDSWLEKPAKIEITGEVKIKDNSADGEILVAIISGNVQGVHPDGTFKLYVNRVAPPFSYTGIAMLTHNNRKYYSRGSIKIDPYKNTGTFITELDTKP